MDTSTHLSYQLDELISSLDQLDALLNVAMSINITELKPDTVLNYFWAASNIVQKTKGMCEELFSKLTRNR